MPDRIGIASAPTAERPRPRKAYFGPEIGWCDVPVLFRADLVEPHAGPCIVEEYDTTCVVPPDATAVLDAFGNIRDHAELELLRPERETARKSFDFRAV